MSNPGTDARQALRPSRERDAREILHPRDQEISNPTVGYTLEESFRTLIDAMSSIDMIRDKIGIRSAEKPVGPAEPVNPGLLSKAASVNSIAMAICRQLNEINAQL